MHGELTARLSNIYKLAGDPESIEQIVVGYDYYQGPPEKGKYVWVTDQEDIRHFCKIINEAEFENIRSELKKRLTPSKTSYQGGILSPI